MHEASDSYPVPQTLEIDLERIRAYWDTLKRGDNAVPFWDDVRLSALADRGASALLIDAFEDPPRFRFNTLGAQVITRYGKTVAGKFCDEVEPRSPFDLLTAQCSATVRRRAPTYYRHSGDHSYGRIILPLWGNGHIGMLLGGIATG